MGTTFVIGIAAVVLWFSTRPETCPALPSSEKLTASQAVRVAECYIRDNGYTDLAPMADRSKLSHDFWLDQLTVDETLKMRHDSLQSKAYGILRGNTVVGGRSDNGWSVAFTYNLNNAYLRARYNQSFFDSIKGQGKVVVMDAYGGNLEIKHSPIALREFQKIRRLW